MAKVIAAMALTALTSLLPSCGAPPPRESDASDQSAYESPAPVVRMPLAPPTVLHQPRPSSSQRNETDAYNFRGLGECLASAIRGYDAEELDVRRTRAWPNSGTAAV